MQVSCHVEHGVHGFGRGVWSEVLRSVFDYVSEGMHPRKTLVSDHNRRISLVVLELNIVPRLVLFDEVVFEKQRVDFGLNNDELYVCDFLDQQSRLPVLVGFFIEVARDAFLQAFGFSDVQQFPLGVIMLVDTRTGRQALQDSADMWRGFHGQRTMWEVTFGVNVRTHFGPRPFPRIGHWCHRLGWNAPFGLATGAQLAHRWPASKRQ